VVVALDNNVNKFFFFPTPFSFLFFFFLFGLSPHTFLISVCVCSKKRKRKDEMDFISNIGNKRNSRKTNRRLYSRRPSVSSIRTQQTAPKHDPLLTDLISGIDNILQADAGTIKEKKKKRKKRSHVDMEDENIYLF
jgi:hypothetical protein